MKVVRLERTRVLLSQSGCALQFNGQEDGEMFVSGVAGADIEPIVVTTNRPNQGTNAQKGISRVSRPDVPPIQRPRDMPNPETGTLAKLYRDVGIVVLTDMQSFIAPEYPDLPRLCVVAMWFFL